MAALVDISCRSLSWECLRHHSYSKIHLLTVRPCDCIYTKHEEFYCLLATILSVLQGFSEGNRMKQWFGLVFIFSKVQLLGKWMILSFAFDQIYPNSAFNVKCPRIHTSELLMWTTRGRCNLKLRDCGIKAVALLNTVPPIWSVLWVTFCLFLTKLYVAFSRHIGPSCTVCFYF